MRVTEQGASASQRTSTWASRERITTNYQMPFQHLEEESSSASRRSALWLRGFLTPPDISQLIGAEPAPNNHGCAGVARLVVVGSSPKQQQISLQAAFVVCCPLDSLTMKARSEMKLPTYVSCPELSRSGAWEAPDPVRCLHRWYRLSDVSLICVEETRSGEAP